MSDYEDWQEKATKEAAALKRRAQYKGPLPSTAAGLPGLTVAYAPELDPGVRGEVFSSNAVAAQDYNRGRPQAVYLRPGMSPEQEKQTIAHELEHLLARQNTGMAVKQRDEFIRMLTEGRTPREFFNFFDGLKESLPYLREKYGLNNAYMTPEFIDKRGGDGLYEILATLASAESANNVDLTKDPELRKTLFKSRKAREAYNAATGLRQTRTDAKDLPPYTKQTEKPEPGIMGRMKHLLGYSMGGRIDNAGNNKLI